MALLPEDIIDRLIQMERRIQALSTAVNTRPLFNEIRPEPDKPQPTKPVLRVFDAHNHELFADDLATGGLARPWLQLMPPVDHLKEAKWPSTTSTSFTAIAQSFNPVWQPKMRLAMYTKVSSGATGQVQVMVDGLPFGPPVAAGQTFDYTGLLPFPDFATKFGKVMTVEIHARIASGTGTVYAQPVSMYGTQT